MICVNKWDKWQSFRKDRGAPPWIKLHRCLMTNSEWALLSDCEKGQVISLWIVAADKNGALPTSNPELLRKIAMLDTVPNIQKFIDLGFLTTKCQPDDNQMTAECQPDDAPEERRGEERREEENRKEYKVPLKNGSFFYPSFSDIEGWVKQYPGRDVDVELLKLIEWNKNTPSKRKTERGIKKHISSWLGNSKRQKEDNELPPEILT